MSKMILNIEVPGGKPMVLVVDPGVRTVHVEGALSVQSTLYFKVDTSEGEPKLSIASADEFGAQGIFLDNRLTPERVVCTLGRVGGRGWKAEDAPQLSAAIYASAMAGICKGAAIVPCVRATKDHRQQGSIIHLDPQK